jgi:hypothetical protein
MSVRTQFKAKAIMLDSDEEFSAPTKSRSRPSMVVDSDDEKPKQSSLKRKSTAHLDDNVENSPPRKKAAVSPARAKAKKSKQSRKDEDYEMEEPSSETNDDDDFIDDEEEVKPKAKRKPPTAKKTLPAKKEEKEKLDQPKPQPAAKPKYVFIPCFTGMLMSSQLGCYESCQARRTVGSWFEGRSRWCTELPVRPFLCVHRGAVQFLS